MPTKKYLTISHLSFRYDSSNQWLFRNINLTCAPGWTGIVGPNGSGKTTLLKLAAGLLEPNQGTIQINEEALFCEQRMDAMSDPIRDFMYAYDSFACKLRARLDIHDGWIDRWDTLSFGERKRLQIAAAIWPQPLILAIDEPTNHLDIRSKEYLFNALEMYEGTGLLVTHDRHFLDNLCASCVFVEPPAISLFKGGYSRSAEQKQADEEHARNELSVARRNLRKLEREHAKRKHEASLADAKRSKRNIGKKDNDARGRRRLAIITGKDGQAGRLQSQLAGRLNHYLEKVKGINAKKMEDLGIWIKGHSSKRDRLLNLEASQIAIEAEFRLNYPDLLLKSDEKVALTGDNGTGKSTLLNFIKERVFLPPDKWLYIPQEISIEQSKRIIDEARRLPCHELGKVMSVVKKLGSDPARLLATELPSPGELRKLLLAIGISKAPELIVMDEPTNHLDLASVECIETALAECPCALLLVSHDTYFLEKLTKTRWHIEKERNGVCVLKKGFW